MNLFDLAFMRQALLAALLVGLAAPVVGAFLVQRGMSLVGDGMGHVALAGVSIGLLTSTSPVFTALLVVAAAAVAIELLRAWGRTQSDVALAVLFYTGIALGVVLIAKSPAGTPANLSAYLFGAILTTSTSDIVTVAILAVVVLAVTTVLRARFFAVANDEEFARASGIPVLGYNIVLGVLTAVTVVVAMRVVGLLLISALMILPNAAGQLLGRSFASATRWAILLGVLASTGGVIASFYLSTPSGGTIVLVAVALFILVSLGTAARARWIRSHGPAVADHVHEHGPGCGHEMILHGDHIDYVHDGELHAAHEGHYDDHTPETHVPAGASGREVTR